MDYLKIKEAIFLAHLNGCLYRSDERIAVMPIEDIPARERINYYPKPQKKDLMRGLDQSGRIIFFNALQEAKFIAYRRAS